MISYLKGTLTMKQPPNLVVEVNGLGYECQAPMSTFYQLPDTGTSVFLHTHFAVREDAHTLYAFATEQERALFRSLIKISGVGPKLALAILSGTEPAQFVRCIQDQDIALLTSIPGVGKKTAERLAIEMRDRLRDFRFDTIKTELMSHQDRADKLMQDAIGALIALGYKPQEASRLISAVKEEYHSTEELIRLALQATIRGGNNDNNRSTNQRVLAE